VPRATLLFALIGIVLPLSGSGRPSAAERIRDLQSRMLAPCCYSEPLYSHRSELALEISREIAAMVAAGKSDRQILDNYISMYGRRILVEPEGPARAWIYSVPALVILCGLVFLVFVIRQLLPPRQAAKPG